MLQVSNTSQLQQALKEKFCNLTEKYYDVEQTGI